MHGRDARALRRRDIASPQYLSAGDPLIERQEGLGSKSRPQPNLPCIADAWEGQGMMTGAGGRVAGPGVTLEGFE